MAANNEEKGAGLPQLFGGRKGKKAKEVGGLLFSAPKVAKNKCYCYD